VVIVKIDNPQGKYYGGLTAAPVTRTMLQQALASRRVAIDRSRLADSNSARQREPEAIKIAAHSPRIVVSWPYGGQNSVRAARPIPPVEGRTTREAVLALHRDGFRVGLRGLGRVTRTAPPSGEIVKAGTIVTLWAE
jgi:hypothetical protein